MKNKFNAFAVVTILALVFTVSCFIQRQKEALMRNELVCSEMQDKVIKQDKDYYSNLKNFIPYEAPSAENHYNNKLHKCFVQLSKFTSISIYDAIENRVLIDCIGKSVVSTEGEGVTCYSENISATPDVITRTEFDRRVKVYMSE